jgi:hypothetical protein
MKARIAIVDDEARMVEILRMVLVREATPSTVSSEPPASTTRTSDRRTTWS